MATNSWWNQDTYWNIPDNTTYYRRKSAFPPVAPLTARIALDPYDGLTYVTLVFRPDQLRAYLNDETARYALPPVTPTEVWVNSNGHGEWAISLLWRGPMRLSLHN